MLRYHLAQDTIDSRDVDQLIAWLKSYPRLTKDQVTLQFEEKWSRWSGRRYSIFCNSGSSANLLMYYALLVSGCLRNKKVIVPATGWVTSVAPAIQFGFEPLMCESDPDTFGLDLNYLESLLKMHRPSAVVLVQVLGVPHKMPALLELKKKYDFILLEDACAAVGSEAYGKRLGAFGDMGSYSLYFGHQASTIEGGVVSTDDREFYHLLLMLRSHGWSKDLDEDSHQKLVQKYQIDDFHSGGCPGHGRGIRNSTSPGIQAPARWPSEARSLDHPFVFYEPGFNLRSTDLNAFIGLGQVDRMDKVARRRHENHELYRKLLGNRFYVQKWEDPEAVVSSIHFAVVAENTEERRTLVQALEKNGIETRIFTAANLGLHPFWFNRYGRPNFPAADRIYSGGFFLPNHPSLSSRDVEFISQVVLEAVCAPKS